MKRNNAIDLARSIAIILIVSCHFLIFSGDAPTAKAGQYLAGVGNFLFFAISAILFFLIRREKGENAFKVKHFLPKRLFRIFIPLWLFLTIALCLYSIIGVQFNPTDAVLNYLGLGWFGKLPDQGHLWFVTMIILCYLMYIIAANSFLSRKPIKGALWIVLLVLSISLELLLEIYGLPGYSIIILFYSLYLFLNGDKYIGFTQSANAALIWISFAVCNALSLFVYLYPSGYPFEVSIQRLSCVVAGITTLNIIMRYGGTITPIRPLSQLATISYEIYLVHHMLCSGRLSVGHLTDHFLLNYLILWLCTIPSAWILKVIGSFLCKKITSVFTLADKQQL